MISGFRLSYLVRIVVRIVVGTITKSRDNRLDVGKKTARRQRQDGTTSRELR